jgi:ABC-type Fe3+ transport system substrate-binding protein
MVLNPIPIIVSSTGIADDVAVADTMDAYLALAELGLTIPDPWRAGHPWYFCPASPQP